MRTPTVVPTEAHLSHDRRNWLRVAKERDEIKAERDQLRAIGQAIQSELNQSGAPGTDDQVAGVRWLRAEVERLNAERAQVWAALNFRPEASLEIVLGDSRLLRPEMAKARQRVQELEGRADWDALYLDGEPELLKRVWSRMRETEARAERAEDRVRQLEAAKPEHWLPKSITVADIAARAEKAELRHAQEQARAISARADATMAQAELAKERARLDWFECYGDTCFIDQKIGVMRSDDGAEFYGDSLRAAIDAAMKEDGK